MAQQKAKVRVKLDTSQAKAQLQGLSKEGEATAGRISDRLSKGSSISGNLMKGASIGAGFALGSSAVKSVGSIVTGGIGDVFSERIGGLAADFDAAIGATDARARQRTLEETRGLFAQSVGERGSLSNATGYYNSVLKLRRQEEQGKSRIQIELAGSGGGKGKGSDADGLVGSIVDPIVGAVRDGFQGLLDLLGA